MEFKIQYGQIYSAAPALLRPACLDLKSNMDRFIDIVDMTDGNRTIFKIQYGQIYSPHASQGGYTITNLKSNMDRFIDYRIYIMLLGVLYLKSNMDRFIGLYWETGSREDDI